MNAITITTSSPVDYKKWQMCGVTIEYHATHDRTSMRKWKSILEKWLPKFESVGAIYDLNRISIGEDIVYFGAGACFENGKEIKINKDPEVGDCDVVSDSLEGVLIHEVVHHIDFKERERKMSIEIDKSTETKLKRNVSMYATQNLLEAIAEIGTGIIIGEDYPDYVHDFYFENGGPMEVYDIG